MLLFNFVCLLYLMVLINSHTISRNIAHDTIDDLVDSINGLEDRREYRPRHDRLHHSYRREEKEAGTTRDDVKIKNKAATLVRDTIVTKAPSKSDKTVVKATKRRSGFWSKFRNRLGNRKSVAIRHENDVFKRRAISKRYRNKQGIQSNKHHAYNDYKAFKRSSNKPGRNRHSTYVDKRKRHISSTISTTTKSNLNTRSFITSHLTTRPNTLKFPTIKTYEASHPNNNLTKTLTELTTRLSNLKMEYGLNKLKTSPISTLTAKYKDMLKNVSNATSIADFVTTTQTTEDMDFLGTAQIEALLNDIKMKAVQMVAEQIPAITDIITNTVTETTFEVDPILTHMSVSPPGYALSTFISIDAPYSKRTAKNLHSIPKMNDTIVITNTESTHQIRGRSISEDVLTISQTIEDALQKSLKKIVKKVQGKLSTQFDKEVKELKTTLKNKMSTVMKDLAHTTPVHSPTSATKPMKTTMSKKKTKKQTKKHKGPVTLRQRHAPKYNKIEPKSKSTQSTQATFDDYMMLTLFEQILAKTHEDNVMKMLTTTEASIDGRDYLKVEKRSLETGTSDKDNSKMYDDILSFDLLDYGSKSSSTENPFSYPTESGAEDTSYEGLSNKICYNDYVNGYKHYLRFQKEQGHQNFSNLLPSPRRKRFFDEDVIEDQDISTKSDDSWFKKHFYLFIDNGPPRKFHTSQTVELKSPITEANFNVAGTGSTVVNPEEEKANEEYSMESNLEALSKSLDDQKTKQFSNIMPIQVQVTTPAKLESTLSTISTDTFFKGLGSLHLVDKLFGKDRTPKHSAYRARDENFLFKDMEREKRTPKRRIDESIKSFHNENSQIRSTVPVVSNNNAYVDVNLIPRPTAIVKLREGKQKKGKLKSFLKRFRFRKRKKTKEIKKLERTKRQYRVQRFDPLKKLKDMFKVKQVVKPSKGNYEIPDYDMMTSHIDTFKPIKYNKVPTIDELKGQIPNITEEHHITNMEKPNELLSSDMSKQSEAQKNSFGFSLDNPVIPEVYESTPNAFANDTTFSYSTTTGPQKTFIKKIQSPYTTTKKNNKLKLTDETSKAFNVNDYKYDSTTKDYLKQYDRLSYSMTQPPMSSLEDIRSEIASLQRKLSMSTLITPKLKPISSTSKFHRYYVTNKKIYVPPHLQVTKPAKTEHKDLKIQTQLTRIAKFPLPHFHHMKRNPMEISEYPVQINNIQKRSVVEPSTKVKKNLNTYVTVTQKYGPISSYNYYAKLDKYKPYPDYFNDLLMWHGDLLNTDKVTVPQWENVLDSIKKDAEFTTLSMTDMQRELMHINEFLGANDVSNAPVTTAKVGVKGRSPMKVEKDKLGSDSNKQQDYFKTVAVKDNAMAKTNDLIIQGEAKYFHFVKQPEFNPEKYIQATDLINNLNKLYFKHPANKNNIGGKTRDTKRDGKFWKTDIDNENKNAKDQDASALLYLDTTLLAYDDGPDFLTERPKHKKMSKTSLLPSKSPTPQASLKPIAKTNQSPVQYFSTPLPMRMNDFERFLKDNQLDVQSVTTPLMALPQFVDTGPKPEAKNNMKTRKMDFDSSTEKSTVTERVNKISYATLSEDSTRKIIDDAIRGVIFTTRSFDMKEINEDPRKYLDIDDKRRKRYSELLNDRFFTFEPFKKRSKNSKLKSHISFFDKKPASTTDLYTVPSVSSNTTDNEVQDQVELTIINMNDQEQSSANGKVQQSPLRHEKAKTNKAKHTTRQTAETTSDDSTTEVTSVTPFIQRVHNNLLYNNYGAHKDKSETTEKVKNDLNDKSVVDDYAMTTFHPLIDQQLFSRLHAKHHPKRVRISSHNYKYDVIYNHEPYRWGNNVVRQYKKDQVEKYNSDSHNDEYKPPYDIFSIADDSARGGKMKRNGRRRWHRQATVSPDTMNSRMANEIETGIPNWREKRRLKLFSNIKGKLKSLLRKPQPTTVQQSTMDVTEAHRANSKPDSEEHKAKREKNGEGLTTDYGFDIDKLFDKDASAFGEEKSVHKENENGKTEGDLLLNNEEFPDLNPLTVPKDILKETTKVPENDMGGKKMTLKLPESSLKTEPETLKGNLNEKVDWKNEELSTTTSKMNALSSQKTLKTTEQKHHKSHEEIYFEPSLDQSQEMYYEPGTTKPALAKSTFKPTESKTKASETKVEKRELQTRGRYTAKDVAALEVIVDLVKNPSSYEEQDPLQAFTETFYQNHLTTVSPPTPTMPMNSTLGTNSIQVHIAIPYNLNMDKKRSIDPLRVRRVFAAKMFTPVDLEYQVQSFEDSTSKDVPLNAPKMYLLIDTNGSLPNSNFTLQPLKGRVDLSNVRVRQVDATKILTQKMETTSSGKNLAKVTLSKNFVAAVNKHLVQLYENLTAINDSNSRHKVRVRKTSYYEEPSKEGRGYRRHINWEAVKKYFGHDRVCNCKCKPNKTMCRACAASDAVISELILEFDNLAKYMNDHCTEIQTFFWMNPSGGKKLRDSIHKVDRTLNDYYKRVRGKCKGKTCNAFGSCIDKRTLVRQKKMPKKYIGDPLIVDMHILADDIQTASKLKICLTDNLFDGGKEFINTIGNCVREERKVTPMTTAKKKLVKNMYSLDNINVNIICKPDSNAVSISTKDYPSSTLASLVSTSALNYMTGHMFDVYNDESVREERKRKGFLRSFARKKLAKLKNIKKLSDVFTYYVTKDPEVTDSLKVYRKRQVAEQIESPLISDTGGSFWHDYYLKASTLYPRIMMAFSKKDPITTTDATSMNSETPLLKTKESTIKQKDISLSTATLHSKKHVFQRDLNATDYSSMDTLTHNINELFKIFHNLTDLKDIETISSQYRTEKDLSTPAVTESVNANENNTRKHTNKIKHKKTKTTSIFKTIKSKFHFKHKHNNTKTNTEQMSTDELSLPDPLPKTTPILNDSEEASITSAKTEMKDSSLANEREDSSTNTKAAITEKVESTTPTITTTVTAKHTTLTPKLKQYKAKASSEIENTKPKSTTVTKDTSDVTTKNTTEESTVSPRDTQATVTDSTESQDYTAELTEKATKSNFFNKIKTATIAFLHNRMKSFQKGTTTTESTEEVRKSRSPVTEPLKVNIVVGPTKVEQNTKTSLKNVKEVTTTEVAMNNPTILIINEYDSDMEPNLPIFGETSLNQANTDHVSVFQKHAKSVEYNLRGLLLSMLNFEAKKLNSEWKRYKKQENQLERFYPESVTTNSKRSIFSLSLTSKPITTSKQSEESDYDILRTLKELQIPTPKGLDASSAKGESLLHKIVSKFGVKVVSAAEPEKAAAAVHAHNTKDHGGDHSRAHEDHSEAHDEGRNDGHEGGYNEGHDGRHDEGHEGGHDKVHGDGHNEIFAGEGGHNEAHGEGHGEIQGGPRVHDKGAGVQQSSEPTDGARHNGEKAVDKAQTESDKKHY